MDDLGINKAGAACEIRSLYNSKCCGCAEWLEGVSYDRRDNSRLMIDA